MKIISLFLLHRDFADASHSKSPKSTAITVLYGIFSLENSYLRVVTIVGSECEEKCKKP